MKNKLAVSRAFAVVLLSLTSSAFAQEAAPAAGAPAPAPAEAAPAEPAPAEAPAADAAPPAEAAPSDAVVGDYPRFRWGISFMGGPVVGGVSGGGGGTDLRFGAQISDLLGLYLQPAFFVGGGVNSSVSNASGSVFGVVGAGLLADFTLINLFYGAIGPELLYGGFASASSSSASASAGTYFSLATRLGIALGSTTPEHKKRFTLGLDMHIVFVPGAVTVMPMIALGYDKF